MAAKFLVSNSLSTELQSCDSQHLASTRTPSRVVCLSTPKGQELDATGYPRLTASVPS
jgi:hypothetical protein